MCRFHIFSPVSVSHCLKYPGIAASGASALPSSSTYRPCIVYLRLFQCFDSSVYFGVVPANAASRLISPAASFSLTNLCTSRFVGSLSESIVYWNACARFFSNAS